MPLYSYSCKSCGNEFDEFQPMEKHSTCKCSRCGAQAEQTLAAPKRGTDVTGLWTNFDEPVNIRGKQHLRDMCKREGMYAPGALD